MYVRNFSPSRKASAKQVRRPRASHLWDKDDFGFYVDPKWCSEQLFEVEQFAGGVWDPCCGLGRIPDAAKHAGYTIYATDIVDRGYRQSLGCVDFLRCGRALATNIVCNPPFGLCDRFVRHALRLTRPNSKVAMIWLVRRLNAARWLAGTPLARIYHPRLSLGHASAANRTNFWWRQRNGRAEMHEAKIGRDGGASARNVSDEDDDPDGSGIFHRAGKESPQ